MKTFVSLSLGIAMVLLLSAASFTHPAPTSTNSPYSACGCFTADFKWKPNLKTPAVDAFFTAGLLPQPCGSSEIPSFEIQSIVWDFGDNSPAFTSFDVFVYHVFGGAVDSSPTVAVCATITATVNNGGVTEDCTYNVCKLINLQ